MTSTAVTKTSVINEASEWISIIDNNNFITSTSKLSEFITKKFNRTLNDSADNKSNENVKSFSDKAKDYDLNVTLSIEGLIFTSLILTNIIHCLYLNAK